jgi:hypothetical protein
MIKRTTRQELINKIENFIAENKLSLQVANNRFPSGENTINLGVITRDEIALDVAELNLKQVKLINESNTYSFTLTKLSNRINQNEKDKIMSEVKLINELLGGKVRK